MADDNDSMRVPPYTQVSASELAAEIAGRRGNDPRTAAVAPASSIPRRISNGPAETWQQRIIRYDENGPGFVGFVLDNKSMLASLVTIRVEEEMADGTWVRTSNPIARGALAAMQNERMDLGEMVEVWYRALDSVGEGWVYFVDGLHGPELHFASIVQVTWLGRGPDAVAAILTDPTQSPTDPDVLRIPARRMMRTWVPRSGSYPDLPVSSFKRAIPDIERYISTRRNIVRVLNSRLVGNGLLHFHASATEKMVTPNKPGAVPTPAKIVDYMHNTTRAIKDDDDPAGVAPFPTSGEQPPVWVEVGSTLDPKALAAEEAALKAVGRSLNYPVQLLLEGPGVGNHWSDIFLNEVFLKEDFASTLRHVFRDMTRGPYRRMLVALARAYKTPLDPRKFRVWYDLSELARRPDDAATVLDLWAAGLISAAAARARLRVSETERPTSEEIALKNRGIGGNRTSTNQSPSAPAVRRGAAAGAIDSTTDELNSIDSQLFRDLDDLATSSGRRIMLEVGERVLALVPHGDPLRATLRAVPPERRWASAPQYLRDQVDVAAVTAEMEGEVSERADHHLSMAVVLVAAVFAKAGMEPPVGLPELVAAGVAAFLAGLGLAVASVLGAPPGSGPRWVPTTVARRAMQAATGAVALRDPDGRPQLADGSWEGGDGPATGPLAVRAVREQRPGLRLLYEWMHGNPPHPFGPHERLDGRVYGPEDRLAVLANPQAFPGPILFPGDHGGCQCQERIAFVGAG